MRGRGASLAPAGPGAVGTVELESEGERRSKEVPDRQIETS